MKYDRRRRRRKTKQTQELLQIITGPSRRRQQTMNHWSEKSIRERPKSQTTSVAKSLSSPLTSFWHRALYTVSQKNKQSYFFKRRCSELLHNAVLLLVSDCIINSTEGATWFNNFVFDYHSVWSSVFREKVLPLHNNWRRWTQNTSDQWLQGKVWPVDRWCRYQPVALSSNRLCPRTQNINSDHFETDSYTNL